MCNPGGIVVVSSYMARQARFEHASADPISHELRLLASIVDSMYVELDDAHAELLKQKYDALERIAAVQRLVNKRRLGVQKLKRELRKRNARFARYVRKHTARGEVRS